jgi:hypothetical protein
VTASLQYAWGNLELRQANYDLASRAYDECLKNAQAETPIHPLTAAAYYKLACVEFEWRNYDNAL